MSKTDRPAASGDSRSPSKPRPAPRVELVTLTVEDLNARYEDVADRTAARVSAKYERLIDRFAERLEAASAKAGHKAWMTTREAASYCGLEYDAKRAECVTLRRWRADGLQATRGRRGWMYRPGDLDAFRARAKKGTDSGTL